MVLEHTTGNRYGDIFAVPCNSVRTLDRTRLYIGSVFEVSGDFLLQRVSLCSQSLQQGDIYRRGLSGRVRTEVGRDLSLRLHHLKGFPLGN